LNARVMSHLWGKTPSMPQCTSLAALCGKGNLVSLESIGRQHGAGRRRPWSAYAVRRHGLLESVPTKVGTHQS
jgi:hypothetical protein